MRSVRKNNEKGIVVFSTTVPFLNKIPLLGKTDKYIVLIAKGVKLYVKK